MLFFRNGYLTFLIISTLHQLASLEKKPRNWTNYFAFMRIYLLDFQPFLWSYSSHGGVSLAFLNWDSQQGRDLATSGRNKKKSIGPILFLCYEESLVSSNLNSKQLRFHGVRPNVHVQVHSGECYTFYLR